ncbi:phosphatase PAP2 family protein (plasmid) [Rossellomorea sp. AcN35-11]|nr:phosphatase PAP2 family protein [Rossellomorea aquimaris]WJV32070.1 phosphatase PAP2 family protein [Rossellomorea sp. AcN35-11]
MDKIDQWVYESVVGQMHPLFEKVFIAITFLADTKMLAVFSVVTVIALWMRKNYKWIIFYIFMMSSGVFLTLLLKLTIQRDRPGGEVDYVEFWGIGGELISYSYPSGHAVKSLLLFGFWFFYLNRKQSENLFNRITSIYLITCPILIGIGQVLLTRHYLSDVIGGFLIGISLLVLSRKLFEQKLMKYSLKLQPVRRG